MSVYRDQHFVASNGETYVLLNSLDNGRLAVVIEAYKAKAFPTLRPMPWVQEDGKPVVEVSGTERLVAARAFASDASIKKAKALWLKIEDIIGRRELYEPGPRWELVTQHAKVVGCSPNTLLRALRLYWQGGQTQDALLGQVRNKAPADAESIQTEEAKLERCRRGRPSTKPGSANYYCNAIDHQNFKQAIEQFWLKDERKTLADTLQYVREHHYSYLDGNGRRYLRPAGEHPTIRQLSSYLRKHYSLQFQLRCRKGDKAFERDHRAIRGTVEDNCWGVAQVYEMDATIVDVTLVSSLSREDIVGRPTLYIIVDRKSRLIVGWYIGFENPCWSAALHALFSIAEDKEALCIRLGIPYDPSDWIATGIFPQHLWLDRGESMSREAEKLARGINVTVTNVPSCRPDWKAVVESRFALTHKAIIDIVPGHNPSANAIKRRSVDYSREAALTLEEFEKVLVMMFITYNRTIQKSFELSRDEIASRVEPSPIALFKHGLATRAGQLAKYTSDSVRLALLPSDAASVNEYGIWVNGMCYQPAAGVNKNSWFVEGRKAVGAVSVSFDRRRANILYVHDRDEPKGYFIAELARHSKKYAQMSVAEAVLVQKLEEELHAGASQSKAQGRSDFHQFAKPITDLARSLTAAATKGISKSGRRTNIKPLRKVEVHLERSKVAIPEFFDEKDANPRSPNQVAQDGNVTYLNAPSAARHEARSPARAARQSMFEGTVTL